MLVQLLFPLIFGEMALMILLLFRTPVRELAIKGLDYMMHGTGLVVVNTLAATLFVVLVSTLLSLRKVIRGLDIEPTGVTNPTDQVLVTYHILEASLLGTSLFLGFMINRLHGFLVEIRFLQQQVKHYQQLLDEAEFTDEDSSKHKD